MMLKKEIWAFLRKEIMLEWRQRFAISGIMLYLVSTVFVAYLAFDGFIPVKTWNALFWLILLFAAINAILKSFILEPESRQLFYYSHVSARGVINAKIMYNAMLMSVLGLSGFGVFVLFMGNPLVHTGVFLLNLLLGMLGFASVLTLVSAIASRARNNFTLMAVLGFPLILPMLLLLIRVSSMAIAGGGGAAADLLIIGLLILITILLSNLLFPYIWKE